MRLAGIRLGDGRLVWVEVATESLLPGDEVVVEVNTGEITGTVSVTPELLIGSQEPTASFLRRTEVVAPTWEDEPLPGSELPPLGSTIRINGSAGIVTRIDPLARTMDVTTDTGLLENVPVDAEP